MLTYNLFEYSQNYSMTSGNLWNFYRDKIDDVDDNVLDDKSFKYKTKIVVGKTPERPELPPQSPQNPDGTQPLRPSQPPQPSVPALNAEVTITLKYLRNFLRVL